MIVDIICISIIFVACLLTVYIKMNVSLKFLLSLVVSMVITNYLDFEIVGKYFMGGYVSAIIFDKIILLLSIVLVFNLISSIPCIDYYFLKINNMFKKNNNKIMNLLINSFNTYLLIILTVVSSNVLMLHSGIIFNRSFIGSNESIYSEINDFSRIKSSIDSNESIINNFINYTSTLELENSYENDFIKTIEKMDSESSNAYSHIYPNLSEENKSILKDKYKLKFNVDVSEKGFIVILIEEFDQLYSNEGEFIKEMLNEFKSDFKYKVFGEWYYGEFYNSYIDGKLITDNILSEVELSNILLSFSKIENDLVVEELVNFKNILNRFIESSRYISCVINNKLIINISNLKDNKYRCMQDASIDLNISSYKINQEKLFQEKEGVSFLFASIVHDYEFSKLSSNFDKIYEISKKYNEKYFLYEESIMDGLDINTRVKLFTFQEESKNNDKQLNLLIEEMIYSCDELLDIGNYEYCISGSKKDVANIIFYNYATSNGKIINKDSIELLINNFSSKDYINDLFVQLIFNDDSLIEQFYDEGKITIDAIRFISNSDSIDLEVRKKVIDMLN